MQKFQKAFGLVLILLAITALSLMFVQTPLFACSLVIGGVITQGILGGVSGKVGPVVGGKWKEIDYLRSYVKPSNPQTVAQTKQRARMTQAVFIARQILGEILQVYWDPYYTNKSGFNAWISENIQLLADTTYNLVAGSIMSKGQVLAPAGLGSTYEAADGTLSIVCDDNTNGSTGLATDVMVVICAGLDGTIYLAVTTAVARSSGNYEPVIEAGLNPTDLITYVFFTRGSGSELQVSDSAGVINSAS